MNKALKTVEAAADVILIWDADNKYQDEEELTTATEKRVEISEKVALLSDSSNSDGEDSDNDKCSFTNINPSRTAFTYSVIGKDGTEWKEFSFSNAERVEERNVFPPGVPRFVANEIIIPYDA